MGPVLRSGVRLEKRLKTHTRGIDKAVPPAEAVENVKRILHGINRELVAETIRIDAGRLDIPVYICRSGRDCNIPTPKTMGKGPTPEQSEASALYELVERYSHANFPRPETHRRGTLRDVEGETIATAQFFHVPHRDAAVSPEDEEIFAALPFAWVPAYSLVRRMDVLLPYEWFADIQGTNGLSAGSTMEETVLQGLCEVVERHVCAVVNAGRKAVPAIDFASVRDPVARELLGKFARHGIRIVCLDFSLDTGIPTVAGIAFDPASYPNSEIVCCAGTATHPEKALIRVLTEIQQMAVDYFRQDYYAGGLLPKFRTWEEARYLFNGAPPVPIQTLPDVSAGDLLEEIERCTAALQRIGFEPLVINITHPLLRLPAVFVLMAGSELYDMSVRDLHATHFLARRMQFIGRMEEAMAMFRRSMTRYPKSILNGTMGIADCLRYLKRWEEAMDAYKEALRYGPDRAMQMQIYRSLELCLRGREKAGQEA